MQSSRLLVLTPDWHHVEGTLYRYQRSSLQENWGLVAKPIPIVVGKNGMVWEKREGDGKSPAGIFSLGPVFGVPAYQEVVMKMPYWPITADLEWVDDPNSQYYNQYVHTSTIWIAIGQALSTWRKLASYILSEFLSDIIVIL